MHSSILSSLKQKHVLNLKPSSDKYFPLWIVHSNARSAHTLFLQCCTSYTIWIYTPSTISKVFGTPIPPTCPASKHHHPSRFLSSCGTYRSWSEHCTVSHFLSCASFLEFHWYEWFDRRGVEWHWAYGIPERNIGEKLLGWVRHYILMQECSRLMHNS